MVQITKVLVPIIKVVDIFEVGCISQPRGKVKDFFDENFHSDPIVKKVNGATEAINQGCLVGCISSHI